MSGENTLNWLHISDLHTRGEERVDQRKAFVSLTKTVAELLSARERTLDLIFITGDVTNEGDRRGYDRARVMLDNLCSGLGVPCSSVYIVPGNHDVVGHLPRDLVKKDLPDLFDEKRRDRVRDLLASKGAREPYFVRQGAFFDFLQTWRPGVEQPSLDSPWVGTKAPPDVCSRAGTEIHILCLNSAWLCRAKPRRGGHDEGPLIISPYQIVTALEQAQRETPATGARESTPRPLVITLSHHPRSALTPFDNEEVRRTLDESVMFFLSGHLHDSRLDKLSGIVPVIGETFERFEIRAGAAYQDPSFANQFNLVHLNLSKGIVETRVGMWGPREEWSPSDDRTIVRERNLTFDSCWKPTNPFHKRFQPFSSKEASTFQKLGRGQATEDVVHLLCGEGVNGVVLYGESGVGKSSVLHAGIHECKEVAARGFRIVDVTAREALNAHYADFVRDNATTNRPGKRRLSQTIFLLDQFEAYLQGDRETQKDVVSALRSLVLEGGAKLLMGLRTEFLARLEDAADFRGCHLLDGLNMPKRGIHPLSTEDAIVVVRTLSAGCFTEGAIRKLVTGLVSKGPAPSVLPAHLLAVSWQIWARLPVERQHGLIEASAIDENLLTMALREFVDQAIGNLTGPQDRVLAPRLLRTLVEQWDGRPARRDQVPWTEIVNELRVEARQLESLTKQLADERIVKLSVDASGRQTVQLSHDCLAFPIHQVTETAQTACREAVRNFFRILQASIRPGAEYEQPSLHIIKEYVRTPLLFTYDALAPKEQEEIRRSYLSQNGEAMGLVTRTLAEDERGGFERASMILDVVVQLLLVMGDVESAGALRLGFVRELTDRHALTDGDEVKKVYEVPHEQLWKQCISDHLPLSPDDKAVLRQILRCAQERREQSFQDLRAVCPGTSRLTLWRVLAYLAEAGQVRTTQRRRGDEGFRWDIWQPRWTFALDRKFLDKFDCREDRRTYKGVLVQIPAGEHAMRTQRVARQLLLRTVAVETRARAAAPGWHEADDKELVDTYSEAELATLVRQIADRYEVMLSEPASKLWILREAQEYRVDALTRICSQVELDVKSAPNAALQGRILADVSGAIAERKDLTRALADHLQLPQPEYFVVSTELDSGWLTLDLALRKRDRLVRVDESHSFGKEVWVRAVRGAVQRLGGHAIVKPLTTEFLKGATLVDLDVEEHELDVRLSMAWERAKRHGITFPSVLVEEFIGTIEKELLVVVVATGKGTNPPGFVNVPPIWYRTRPVGRVQEGGEALSWWSDRRCDSVPIAFEEAWIDGEDSPEDGAIGARAVEDSRRFATDLWRTAEAKGSGMPANRFLELEWFVANSGKNVYLNEVKPTQLDKGVVSHLALTCSDSELLVRSLFDLPLPTDVARTSPGRATVLAAVVAGEKPEDIRKILRPLPLIGFDGVSETLGQADGVCLYPDKMRSLAYIGRRIGVVWSGGATVAAARQRVEAGKKCLRAIYQQE